MSGKKRIIVIVVASVAALLLILYLGGMLGQVLQNYAEWRENDGMAGKVQIKAVNPNPINSDIEIIRGEYGKPYLKGNENFHFNISHTHNAIAIAIADTPIGIDIERIRPLNASIVKRLYSIKEKEYVYSVADVEDRRFSEIWTRKEAYIKRDDRNISLSSFRIDTFKDAIDRQIKTFCIGEYIISVCGNQTVEKIDLTNQEKFHYNVVDMQTSM